MFHTISEAMLQQMAILEEIDARDRVDGTPRMQRLRQIPPETGKFLALLAASAPQGHFIEIGTSAGYSTLWLALACQERGHKITTFEVLEAKHTIAKQTFEAAHISEYIDLIHGNAIEYLDTMKTISFCFLDAEKELYDQCYEKIIPNMVKGGIFIADNAINHYEKLQMMIEKALHDPRVDSLVVPIGKGELLCRKL